MKGGEKKIEYAQGTSDSNDGGFIIRSHRMYTKSEPECKLWTLVNV